TPGSTDQRGAPFVRSAGVAVDIGAYESQQLNLVVNTNADEDDGNFGPGDLSLREALRLTNANPGADTIAFSSFFKNTLVPRAITLVLGQLGVRDDVTITGPGAALLRIGGRNATRVFDVADFRNTVSRVTLSRLTIS